MKFDKGKTNEEVLRHYAGKGVTIPETFLSKARKQYENLKKQTNATWRTLWIHR